MAKSTTEEAEAFVDGLVEEWEETPPLRGLVIRVQVTSRESAEGTYQVLASGEVRCGNPKGR